MLSVYAFVPLATLTYLMVDMYPSVKSFTGILRTFSFLLLWLIFSILNIIACAALKLAASAKILPLLGDQGLTDLTIVILSTLSTLTILQSLTLKVADYKFIDVGQLMEAYRKRVLEDIGNTVSTSVRLNEQTLSDKLFAKFQNDLQGLRNEYAYVMSFGGRTLAQIGQELTQLQMDAQANNLSFERQLSSRIAKTDPARAKQLLHGP